MQNQEIPSIYVEKRQSSQKALHNYPISPSMGPTFVGRGRVISGHMMNRLGSQFAMNTKITVI